MTFSNSINVVSILGILKDVAEKDRLVKMLNSWETQQLNCLVADKFQIERRIHWLRYDILLVSSELDAFDQIYAISKARAVLPYLPVLLLQDGQQIPEDGQIIHSFVDGLIDINDSNGLERQMQEWKIKTSSAKKGHFRKMQYSNNMEFFLQKMVAIIERYNLFEDCDDLKQLLLNIEELKKNSPDHGCRKYNLSSILAEIPLPTN